MLCYPDQTKYAVCSTAFAWLPDKTTASYYACLFLIMSAFCEHSDEINQIYGRSSFALRKIKCDFEVGIHLGWQMFRISGCYFHYTQVTTKLMFLIFKLPLKAIWRKVQELGLVRAYMSETEVQNFIKMLDALPFLPVDRIGMIIC